VDAGCAPLPCPQQYFDSELQCCSESAYSLIEDAWEEGKKAIEKDPSNRDKKDDNDNLKKALEHRKKARKPAGKKH